MKTNKKSNNNKLKLLNILVFLFLYRIQTKKVCLETINQNNNLAALVSLKHQTVYSKINNKVRNKVCLVLNQLRKVLAVVDLGLYSRNHRMVACLEMYYPRTRTRRKRYLGLYSLHLKQNLGCSRSNDMLMGVYKR